MAVIVSGQALGYIMVDDVMRMKFLAVAMQAVAVVACRVSPPQKASIVQLVSLRLAIVTNHRCHSRVRALFSVRGP
jgi:magnesium-transporting ATPase (P-type)